MCICEAAHGKKVYTEAEVHQRIKEAGFANDKKDELLRQAGGIIRGEALAYGYVRKSVMRTWLAEYAEHKGE